MKFKGIVFTTFSLLAIVQLRGYCIYYTGSDGPKVTVKVFKGLRGYQEVKASYELTPGQQGCWNWEDIRDDVFDGDADERTNMYMRVERDGRTLAQGALQIGSYAEIYSNGRIVKVNFYRDVPGDNPDRLAFVRPDFG